MPVAIVVTEQIRTDLELLVRGTMVFSGTYPTGGEPISFAGLGIKSNKLTPKRLDIYPSIPAGWILGYDYTNAKCMVFTNSSGGANLPLTELGAVAYPAGIISPAVHRFELVLNP